MKTAQEQLQRMEALVKRMAKRSEMHATGHDYDEARAIVAEIDGYSPSKEALAYIKFEGVPAGPHWDSYPEWSNESYAKAYDDGIAKGRELALAEVGDKLHAANYFRAFHLLGLQHVK